MNGPVPTGLRLYSSPLAWIVVVERGERIEQQRGCGESRGVVDADLERVEAGDVELQAEGDAASPLLRQGRAGEQSNSGAGENGVSHCGSSTGFPGHLIPSQRSRRFWRLLCGAHLRHGPQAKEATDWSRRRRAKDGSAR